MWLPLSLLALFMLSVRRSTEKKVSSSINSMALVWLQQATALPLIVVTLFFAKFYWPSQLPAKFWYLLAVFVATSSLDLYCYFKALSIADISFVAPIISLFAVGNLAGSYLILGQKPSLFGVLGAVLIVFGAYLNNLAKKREKAGANHHKLALILLLISVLSRSFYANIEVLMLRVSNPTSYNFYSSVLTVPFVLIISIMIVRQRKAKYVNYWSDLRIGVKRHVWPLIIIGTTYTINLLASYQAKLISPNAGYVGAVKSAAVLPMVLIGVFFFKEKIVRMQWVGLAFILLGLLALATN